MDWLITRVRAWPTLFGYALFIGMMATGYYYSITFVQLGVVDLGERIIGLSKQAVASHMAYLALLTSVISLLVGWLMKRRGWSGDFFTKLRLAFIVVLVQTMLTALAPYVRGELAFLAWISVTAAALGVGVPATFGLTVDLVPRRGRGYAGAFITATAYFAAAVFSSTWTIEAFRAQILWAMLAGTAMIGVLAFRPFCWTQVLAQQHLEPRFRYGRFLRIRRGGRPRVSRKLLGFIFLMAGIYFIDSLGFLRLIATPIYVDTAWLSATLAPRLIIGVAHVVAALVAGVLYTNLDERGLFMWIFGIFALAHLMYTFPLQFAPANAESNLAPAMLYSIAVSLYTVVTFAVWADISTPATISLNAAVGVALSSWAATFISTALAIRWELGNVPVVTHLRIVASLSTLFFLGLLIWAYFDVGGDRSCDVQATEGD
jgi:MFS family permease